MQTQLIHAPSRASVRRPTQADQGPQHHDEPQVANSERAGELGLGPAPEDGRMEAAHASPDHIELGGDEHRVAVGEPPVVLTTGQINALVDYVPSIDDLNRMPGPAIERGCVLIAKAELSAAEKQELSGIFPHYEELSFANSDHFAPPDPALCEPSGSGGRNHVSELSSLLTTAVEQATTGGLLGQPEALGTALASAAWAGHYIADAYSAGHLFNKDDVMAKVEAALADPASYALLLAHIPDMATRICADGAATLERFRYQPATGLPTVAVGPGIVGTLLTAVLTFQQDVLGNGIALAVHEALGHQGVEVTGAGVRWRMFGDGALDAVSQVQCVLTIEQAYDQVEQAFLAPGSVAPREVVQGVLDRLPRPTEGEQESIRQTIEAACSVESGGMMDAVVAGSVHMLEDILLSAGAKLPGAFVEAGSEDQEEEEEEDQEEEEHEEEEHEEEEHEVPGAWLPQFGLLAE